MKRATVLKHIRAMSDEATRLADLTAFDWPLREMWLAGDILDGATTLDYGTVVLVLDTPVAEMPWRAIHPDAQYVAECLKLGKIQMNWMTRPFGLPAWNPETKRVARFWERDSGEDDTIVESLRAGGQVATTEPTPEQYTCLMEEELRASRTYLDSIVDQYWDRDWRKQHRGFGIYPENHLWLAARSIKDIEAALSEHRG